VPGKRKNISIGKKSEHNKNNIIILDGYKRKTVLPETKDHSLEVGKSFKEKPGSCSGTIYGLR
jgi:hypothetical protein